jgi:hypothetical protein
MASAKGTDARSQTGRELAGLSGGAADSVPVERVFPGGEPQTARRAFLTSSILHQQMHFMQLRLRTLPWVRKRQNKIEILRFGPFRG